MKKTLLTILAAFLNLVMGALAYVWAGILFLGAFAGASDGRLPLLSAIGGLLLLATLVTLINLLLLKLCRLPPKSYIPLCGGMFAAGMVLFFLGSIVIG